MKLTATSLFNVRAKGSAKTLLYKFYARKVTSLSQALSGTWTEITSRIQQESFAEISSRIEFQVGQFTSNSLELTAKGINWLKNNIFNPAANEYIEFKIEFQIVPASDVIAISSGFIDKNGWIPHEIDDTISFTAFTATDLGYRKPAEVVSIQPIRTNVDGASHDGLILATIWNVYVIDVNIASYPLNLGTHQIYYEYNSGSKRMRLNNGGWVSIPTTGTYTLGDGDVTANDKQRVKIYIAGITPSDDLTYIDDIVVITTGQTLPRKWYKDAPAYTILEKLYNEIGITNITFDPTQLGTWDGNYRAYYYDNPPNDVGISGNLYTLTTDGTDLYMSIDDRIYKRTISTGQYTHLTTIPAGTNKARINRLWHNARNNHLWILYDEVEPTTQPNGLLRRLDLTTNTLSTVVTLETGTTPLVDKASMEIIDFNYSGSNYKYGLVYTDKAAGINDLRFVDGSTLTISNAGQITSTIQSIFLFYRGSGSIYFKTNTSGANYQEIFINSSGAFVDNGIVLTGVPAYSIAIYNTTDQRVVYTPTTGTVKSHNLITPSTETTHVTGAGNTEWFAYGNNKVWFTTSSQKAYSVSGTAAAVLLTTETQSITIQNTAITYSDRLWGITSVSYAPIGKLFQISTILPDLVRMADFENVTVTDMIYKILNAYHLMGTISSMKKAFVYRRGNSTGVPQTTGNVLSLTNNEIGDIEEIKNYFPKKHLIIVSNDESKVTYDGTNFDIAVLSDREVLEINNNFIPTEILKDIAYYAYQFFKNNLSLYRVTLPIIPLFQYEPFDKIDIVVSGNKIPITGNGPIYAVTSKKDGTMVLEAAL